MKEEELKQSDIKRKEEQEEQEDESRAKYIFCDFFNLKNEGREDEEHDLTIEQVQALQNQLAEIAKRESIRTRFMLDFTSDGGKFVRVQGEIMQKFVDVFPYMFHEYRGSDDCIQYEFSQIYSKVKKISTMD